MADWTNITDSQVDPDAPLTSEIAYAWRDNPIAIAEGAVGAPRIEPIANGNPRVAFSSVSGTGYAAFNGFQAGTSFIKISGYFDGVNTGLQAAISLNNGVSYGSDVTLETSGNTSGTIYELWFDFKTGSMRGVRWGSNGSRQVVNTTLTSGGNAIRFRSVASRDGYFIVRPMAGDY